MCIRDRFPMADDPIHQTWDPWKNPWITGIDETTVRDREFRREVLGEFVPPESLLRESRIYRSIYSRRVDAIRYMREQFRDRIIRPAQVRDRFMLISPALAGELEPDAMVAFDRDLEPVIANPVFITRWGHLYIARLLYPSPSPRD